jgi:hypothetical protein
MKNITVTEAEFAELNEEYGGFCLACGEQAYGVEPDAENYSCESCGEDQVFGVEQLLVLGKINIS